MHLEEPARGNSGVGTDGGIDSEKNDVDGVRIGAEILLSQTDGESLYGWEPGSQADWKVDKGTIGVSSGEKGLLCTTTEWGDYVVQCDFRAPAATNRM